MQAVCDHEGRFLDIDLSMPGRTSDHLAFTTSDLHSQLDNDLLAEGLCLFGDAAHVNTSHMATPFKTPRGTEDNCNFHHSQLRIKIECAFGMLVNRWGTLRRAMSATIGLKKLEVLFGEIELVETIVVIEIIIMQWKKLLGQKDCYNLS